MERKTPFSIGEIYHLYTRGVEKRIVFKNEHDYVRFLLLLFLCNSGENVHIANLFKKYQGESLLCVFDKEKRGKQVVEILSYVLMPNHIHIVARERVDGGISKFMLKLMTAYSMYFNARYERSGPLFTRPFRSVHIDTNEYFMHVFSYVTLNPLELFQSDWKESGLKNLAGARKFMRGYRYSSYFDYFIEARPQSTILSKDALPIEKGELSTFDSLLSELSKFGKDKGEPLILGKI